MGVGGGGGGDHHGNEELQLSVCFCLSSPLSLVCHLWSAALFVTVREKSALFWGEIFEIIKICYEICLKTQLKDYLFDWNIKTPLTSNCFQVLKCKVKINTRILELLRIISYKGCQGGPTTKPVSLTSQQVQDVPLPVPDYEMPSPDVPGGERLTIQYPDTTHHTRPDTTTVCLVCP